jgi:stage V sporulation protein S
MDVIKVAGSSRTSAVAGAIAGVFRENHRAEIQAIGAGAVNQAVKAMVLATSYLKNDGYAITFMPRFSDVDIDGKIRTAVKFYVMTYDGDFNPDDLNGANPMDEPDEAGDFRGYEPSPPGEPPDMDPDD